MIKFVFTLVFEPALFLTISVTVKVPGVKYLCLGFFSVEVVPSPNFQRYEVGVPVDLSVKEMVRGAWPEVTLALNWATGAWTTTGV